MKTYILLIALALCTSNVLTGQKILKESVKFNDVRLPLAPLSDDLAGYQFTVSTPYPENAGSIQEHAQKKYDEAVANYSKLVEESEVKHEEALAQYEADVEMSRENFKIESDEFNKMKLVERLALADDKPKLKLPSKPIYRKPREPRLNDFMNSNSITFDPTVLADSFLKLDGFEKKSDAKNTLVGDVKFYDFEYDAPLRKSKQVKYYDAKAKKHKTKTEYYYITAYKRPTRLTLMFNDESLYDGIFETTIDKTELETKSSPQMKNVEKQTIDDILVEINDYINNNYGFSKIDTEIEVRYVKNKDDEYTDVEGAMKSTVSGYKQIEEDMENNDLLDGIEAGEKILEEFNPDDRKARVNNKVAVAVLFNLLQVSTYTNNFDAAKTYLSQLEDLKLNYTDKEFLKSFKLIMEDKIVRFDKNQ